MDCGGGEVTPLNSQVKGIGGAGDGEPNGSCVLGGALKDLHFFFEVSGGQSSSQREGVAGIADERECALSGDGVATGQINLNDGCVIATATEEGIGKRDRV